MYIYWFLVQSSTRVRLLNCFSVRSCSLHLGSPSPAIKRTLVITIIVLHWCLFYSVKLLSISRWLFYFNLYWFYSPLTHWYPYLFLLILFLFILTYFILIYFHLFIFIYLFIFILFIQFIELLHKVCPYEPWWSSICNSQFICNKEQ